MSTENNKQFDLKVLEAFQAAMSCGSMTRAATQLGIGQPAVTRMVKELEIAVGFPLFHRNGPRISPTDRGLQFYEEVQRVVAGVRQIGQRADADHGGWTFGASPQRTRSRFARSCECANDEC